MSKDTGIDILASDKSVTPSNKSKFVVSRVSHKAWVTGASRCKNWSSAVASSDISLLSFESRLQSSNCTGMTQIERVAEESEVCTRSHKYLHSHLKKWIDIDENRNMFAAASVCREWWREQLGRGLLWQCQCLLKKDNCQIWSLPDAREKPLSFVM